jgi:pantoate--beta-alanine ligase
LKIVRTIEEMRAERRHLKKVGLVPTMGAFHEGHLELMRQAREKSGSVVVSLFVNPTQFGPSDDFHKYPRQEARDAEMAESVGVDVIFAPSPEEMYQRPHTKVCVEGAAEGYEGDFRPGHFDGVATVVLKLFDIIQPTSAFFGLKDLQQCAVIRQMVRDLNVPVRVELIETVRETKGLALSSRNKYLTTDQRSYATSFSEVLKSAAQSAGLRGTPIHEAVHWAKSDLIRRGFEVDYVAMVDAETMRPSVIPDEKTRIVAAIRYEGVRLIDNFPVPLKK